MVETTDLRAPFPWFGSKRLIAAEVWRALGDVRGYVEPFAGSLAVLLQRPHPGRVETVNDADGLLSNAWRAIKLRPTETAEAADWPVNEADLHARHLWLVGQRAALTERLMSDPDWCDPQAAGWWVWGASAWIGSGWCSGRGPWGLVDGVFARLDGNAGMGINRQLPHVGAGMGINRKLPHVGNAGRGTHIAATFAALSARLRDVRVACGDWSRVCGPSVLRAGGAPVGIFLDPPYHEGDAAYAGGQGAALWRDVCAYAVDVGASLGHRVVLCGYEGGFAPPPGWRTVEWKARGGYGSQGDGDGRANANRERLWLSPGCLGAEAQTSQCSMFAGAA